MNFDAVLQILNNLHDKAGLQGHEQQYLTWVIEEIEREKEEQRTSNDS